MIKNIIFIITNDVIRYPSRCVYFAVFTMTEMTEAICKMTEKRRRREWMMICSGKI